MSGADWVILAVIAGSALISLVRGFVREALSLVAWVVAFAVAMVFHAQLASQLTGAIETPSLRAIAAWLALFLVTLLVMGLINFPRSTDPAAEPIGDLARQCASGVLEAEKHGDQDRLLPPGVLPYRQKLRNHDQEREDHDKTARHTEQRSQKAVGSGEAADWFRRWIG